jgi:hypothetical protein
MPLDLLHTEEDHLGSDEETQSGLGLTVRNCAICFACFAALLIGGGALTVYLLK